MKIFVTATPEVRARRRALELQGAGVPVERGGGPGRYPAPGRARHREGGRAPETRAGCALARYHAFGYRRRIPGRHRHCRSRPSRPEARLTALSSWRMSLLRPLRDGAPGPEPSFRSLGYAGPPQCAGGAEGSSRASARALETPFIRNRPTVDQESSWPPLPQVPPRRRAKISRNARRVVHPGQPCRKAPSSRARSSASRRTSPSSTSGAKTEGRVALREFAGPGRQAEIKVGDTVEVYLERVENALGEAVLSRDKARREESWGKLEKAFQEQREGPGRHLQPGQGRLHRRSRRRRGVPAAQPGRHPPDPRRRPADERSRSRSRS